LRHSKSAKPKGKENKNQKEKPDVKTELDIKYHKYITKQSFKKNNEIHVAENDLTLLNIDLWYFPDREHSEQWQWMLFDFLLAARHNFVIVYGTIGMAIIVKMNIGNSALFSSEAAIVPFCTQQPQKVTRPAKATLVIAHNPISQSFVRTKISNYKPIHRIQESENTHIHK